MDRFLYLSMSGAKENLYAQAINNHNLANANTYGFRQSLAVAYTAPIRGPVYDSRDYVQTGDEAIDFTPGALQNTGRDLDLAIQDQGFFAVQTQDGEEAYSRAGDFHVDPAGILRNERGLAVLGDNGSILTIPPEENIVIGDDGTITVRPQGSQANALVTIGRIKLVNPDVSSLVRGVDGLFRPREKQTVPTDANVRVVTGMLETSNVNSASALTKMIELSRHFELQIKMMETASNLEKTDSRLLSIS